MATTTKLTHPVAPRDRILPVESTDGFRAGDGASICGEYVRIRRVNSERSFTVDRGGTRLSYLPGANVVRVE